jgi:hypothetical protein
MTGMTSKQMVVEGDICELGDHDANAIGPALVVTVKDIDGDEQEVVIPATKEKLIALGACLYRRVSITITVEED